jgi:hypothetical protein
MKKAFVYLAKAWLALVVMAVLPAYGTNNASEGFQPPSPDELKMTAEPLEPGAPAIILFRQVDRDDNSQTSHEYNYFRIKILTEEGRKYADIEIPFYKESGNVVNLKARTIRPDGSIANFEGKAFDKSIVKAKGLKYLAKTLTLPDVQVGSIIEYYFTLDLSEHYVYDSHWILSDELFTKSAKFSLKPYRSEYSPLHVRWSWQGLPTGTQPPAEGPNGIVRLESGNIPAFQTEDFMPPESEMKSRVDFIYSEEPFENDPVVFWKKIGKKRNDALENFLNKRKAMEQAVAQIVSPSDPPEVKLQKIYARVQQMRNTSYEVRKSEQEEKRAKEKVPDNVEDIWKRGYGSGSDLTWLYLALVRAAGLEAYGVLASDRYNYFFYTKAMNTRKLDSNVVLVKLNGKDIYCDPGAEFTPYGMLPLAETAVPGLRLDKDGGTWLETSLPESAESQIRRKADLKLSDTGDLEGKLTVTFTGLEASRRRVEERNADEAERKKFLEDEVREAVPAAIETELLSKPDWSSSASPLVAEFSLKVPGWASGAGRRALVTVGLFSAPEKRLFDHTNRVHPIYIEFPFQRVDDVTIQLPEGWKVTSLPPAQSQPGKVVNYTLKVENDKDKLRLARLLDIDFLLVTSNSYGALRGFFQAVRSGDEAQIVLQPEAVVSSH